MTQNQTTSLTTFYKGWDVYQQELVKAIAPLTPEQLALRAAPHLRSILDIATHIIAVRARWFHDLMGEGNEDIASIAEWDHAGAPVLSAQELVNGFEKTWQMIQNALARWTPTDLEYIFEGTHDGEEYQLSRQWVVWHVIEHDLHHGGELSFSLGMHGLAAPDL
ncbi:MAG: hypothetical protein NVSMB33_17850 [Ktedonobacteraceae bacterium]